MVAKHVHIMAIRPNFAARSLCLHFHGIKFFSLSLSAMLTLLPRQLVHLRESHYCYARALQRHCSGLSRCLPVRNACASCYLCIWHTIANQSQFIIVSTLGGRMCAYYTSIWQMAYRNCATRAYRQANRLRPLCAHSVPCVIVVVLTTMMTMLLGCSSGHTAQLHTIGDGR